jgi:hypothetical protein
MGSEEARDRIDEGPPAAADQFTGEPAPAEVPAWEQVDTGRYMPRRIKGSCKGRALG